MMVISSYGIARPLATMISKNLFRVTRGIESPSLSCQATSRVGKKDIKKYWTLRIRGILSFWTKLTTHERKVLERRKPKVQIGDSGSHKRNN